MRWQISVFVRWVVCGVVLSFGTGCGTFRTLKNELMQLRMSENYMANISAPDGQSGPVYGVILDYTRDGRILAGDLAQANSAGMVVFLMPPARGEGYHWFAFQDQNRDEHWQQGEPCAFLPATKDTSIHTEIKLSQHPEAAPPGQLLATIREMRHGRPLAELQTGAAVPVSLGKVASINDAVFAAEGGAQGLWQPATFLHQRGIGVYFLDDYDPAKIPVLFVHGAAGSGQDWKNIIHALDRKKYQAWIAVYPTGLALDKSATAIHSALKILHGMYRFERLHVVAHSMGGLMARAMILKNRVEEGNLYIRTFVTLSTPWNGHEAAAWGVEKAPTAVPSWYDVQTDSPFIRTLFKTDLSRSVEHHLLFGYAASRSRLLPDSNDGTVSVASQLDARAQKQARAIYGFDVDHMGILQNPECLEKLFDLLDSASQQKL